MPDKQDISAVLDQAVALHDQGNLAEAKAEFDKVLALQPENLEALKRLSGILVETGDGEGAFKHAAAAQKIRPKSKSVLTALAAAAMVSRRWGVAVQCYQVLTRAEPENAAHFWDWSRAEFELNNLTRAIERYHDFLKILPGQKPEHQFVLGRLYFQNRQPALAAEWLDKALAGGFETSELLAIRANCYLHTGRQDQAREFFERAIATNASNVEAHFQYRQLVKTKAGDPIFKTLEALQHNQDLRIEQKVVLNFLLANLYQGQGDYPKAFAGFVAGNALNAEVNQVAGFAYDRGAVAGEFTALKATFFKEALAALSFKASDSDQPVFIVGMPRSGTTLLEQIISAHQDASGRGEMDAMHYIHGECQEALKAAPLDEVLASRGDEWGARYLSALTAGGEAAGRITDKLPANFKSLGLISALFPNAKIIHIHRNPLDTAVSIFCNMFDKGHPYATSLANIGDYYRHYHDLMAHWRSVFSSNLTANFTSNFMEISYEDLVAAQEKKSKEVISFLDLPWDAACLEFHKQDNAAMTLSSIQVRKPMSASAIGRWERYKDFLEPLFESLGPELANQSKGRPA